MSEKHFNAPVENALCGCQFGVKLGKIGDTVNGFWPPKKVFFRFRFRTSVLHFVEIGSKLRPWEHGQTDRQTDTHTHRDHTSDLIICPMLCYSNGTDNDLKSLAYIIIIHSIILTSIKLSIILSFVHHSSYTSITHHKHNTCGLTHWSLCRPMVEKDAPYKTGLWQNKI